MHCPPPTTKASGNQLPARQCQPRTWHFCAEMLAPANYSSRASSYQYGAVHGLVKVWLRIFISVERRGIRIAGNSSSFCTTVSWTEPCVPYQPCLGLCSCDFWLGYSINTVGCCDSWNSSSPSIFPYTDFFSCTTVAAKKKKTFNSNPRARNALT